MLQLHSHSHRAAPQAVARSTDPLQQRRWAKHGSDQADSISSKLPWTVNMSPCWVSRCEHSSP